MHRRQPLPRLWMMTDERQGDGLFDAVKRLPKGAGLVFRHYSLSYRTRRRLFARVMAAARRRRIVVIVGGEPQLAKAWGADGSHGPGGKASHGLLRTAPVHNVKELRAAERAGADLVFASPVFPTRSHSDAQTLGPTGLGLILRTAHVPVVALGGMNPKHAARLRGLNIYGWAAIDAWSED